MRSIWDKRENVIRGTANRVLQSFATILPSRIRVLIHRARGVKIGNDVWIGAQVMLDNAYPWLITIEDIVTISVLTRIVAHFRELQGVKVEHGAFIGAGALILPGVTIGHGAVIATGGVVSSAVPAMTMVRGNPAVPVARCGTPLMPDTTFMEFSLKLRPLNFKSNLVTENGENHQMTTEQQLSDSTLASQIFATTTGNRAARASSATNRQASHNNGRTKP